MNSSNESEKTRGRHAIAVVARRTGISQLLLRAWERRYGAIRPDRTDTGRRRYSDDDVNKLLFLKKLTESGHRIGDIAELGSADLEELVEEIVESPVSEPVSTGSDELLGACLEAVAKLDAKRLEALLTRASVSMSRPLLRKDLIHPLLVEIGDRWGDGRFRVAHEHVASAIIRTFLGGLDTGLQASSGAPVLVAATPSGQSHEMGAMMASSTALEMGWNAIYLGSDLPVEEIAAAALGNRARAILLSLVYPGSDPATIEQLHKLRHLVGADITILAGGQAAGSYQATLNKISGRLITELGTLGKELGRLA